MIKIGESYMQITIITALIMQFYQPNKCYRAVIWKKMCPLSEIIKKDILCT